MRFRPVMVYSAVMAGAGVVAASADFADMIPPTALKWFLLCYAVASVVGGILVQGQVTPLAAPRDADGTALVPANGGR